MELKVGGDPEFFLQSGERLIASCGLVGGTKKDPLMLASDVGVLEDGVAVEINYDPKVWEPGSMDAFNFAVQAKSTVEQFLLTKNKNYLLYNAPEHEFRAQDLVHPNAKIFGCDPDFNAWTGAPNIPPKLSEIGNYRFAGGHLHFGYDKEKCKIPVPCLVQFLDGLVTTRMCAQSQWAVGRTRRKYYGRPGSFRDKPYGFEYRVLSSGWFNDADDFNRIVGTVHWLLNNQDAAFGIYQKIEAIAGSIQNTILGLINDPAIGTILREHREQIDEYIFGNRNRNEAILRTQRTLNVRLGDTQSGLRAQQARPLGADIVWVTNDGRILGRNEPVPPLATPVLANQAAALANQRALNNAFNQLAPVTQPAEPDDHEEEEEEEDNDVVDWDMDDNGIQPAPEF